MSAIFGIYNLDGRPVEAAELHCLQQAMSRWGPDGGETWSQGPVGLGHMQRHDTPESHRESLPLHSASGTVLTSSGRLDNRDELCGMLGVPPGERAQTPDGALIAAAYQKWGADSPDYLLGDWSFACWDARAHRLFIARDYIGNRVLYYYQNDRTFVFASALKGLLAHPEVPRRLHPEHFAQFFPGFRCTAATPYRDILPLRPGHTLTVTPDRTALRRYWHPDDIPEVRYSSDQEYVDAFSELYAEAVRCRLRSSRPVGLSLSGGLDSGSIAVLAGRELARGDQRLAAFSSVPLYSDAKTTNPLQIEDETPFIEATCRAVPNMDLTYIRAEEVTPLTGIRRALDILEQPTVAESNAYWNVALYQAAEQQGIGPLLTGWAGNLTISWAGNRQQYLSTLLKSGQWLTYLRDIRTWQDVQEASLGQTVKANILRLLVPTGWWQWHSKRRMQTPLRTLMNPEYDQSLSHVKDGQWREFRSDPIYRKQVFPHRVIYNYFRNGQTDIASEAGAAFGLDVRDPALDKRLVHFCLGIPQDQYTRNGQERLLIRRAMTGLLPEEILWNKYRGMQGADLINRLQSSRDEVEAALETIERSAMAQQYLNVPVIRKVFSKLGHEPNPAIFTRVVKILARGLGLGLFLQRFEGGE